MTNKARGVAGKSRFTLWLPDSMMERIAGYRNRVWKVLTRDFFPAYVPVESVLLDLGCGWGEFVSNIEARVKYGMDLNPESRRRLAPRCSC